MAKLWLYVALLLVVSLQEAVLCARAGHGLVSRALGDHMVLQRGPDRARLWGWTANGGERVSVTLDKGDQFHTVSDRTTHKWVIHLPPHPAGGPHTIDISASTEKATLTDIFFGDVYVCGGQSNMQMTVSEAFNASQEISQANRYPHIRVFTVGQGTISNKTLDDFETVEQPWSIANSTSIGGKPWEYFSAACWFFAKEVFDEHKVPIGLVSSNWGGTIIQAWSSPEALAHCKQYENTQPRPVLQQGGSVDPNQPSVLWNAMIVPLLEMRLRGFLWYQGESNVGQDKYYTCAFPTMISDWRHKWQDHGEQLAFLFVQLAPWITNGPVAELRQAQTAALTLHNVGMATAIDLGDPAKDNPYGDIHPRNKQAVGYRLKLNADVLVYGQKHVVASGPQAAEARVISHPPKTVVRITFLPHSLGGGLEFRPATCPSTVPVSDCSWFALQTSDGKWHNATATLEGSDRIDLAIPAEPNVRIIATQYGYSAWPVCTLYDKHGLPALPWSLRIRP